MILAGDIPDDNEFRFNDLQDALDCYRDGFTSIAENIADYGGEFTITLYQQNLGKLVLIKRNTIGTTENIM